jgi:hypothetical protein
MAEIDWKMLRGRTIMLVVCLSIGAGLVYGGLQQAELAEREYRRAHGHFQGARRRYLTLDDQQRLIEQFYPQYQALEKGGIIGAEMRLSWVETLKRLARGLKMPVMRYEISSQEEFRPTFDVPQGTFKVFTTDMRLNIGLLHEADLPAVITALSEAASGLFTVSGCSIKRRPIAFSGMPNPRKPNVDAACRLRWYVVKKPEPSA